MLTFNVILGYQGLLFPDFLWFLFLGFFFQSDRPTNPISGNAFDAKWRKKGDGLSIMVLLCNCINVNFIVTVLSKHVLAPTWRFAWNPKVLQQELKSFSFEQDAHSSLYCHCSPVQALPSVWKARSKIMHCLSMLVIHSSQK